MLKNPYLPGDKVQYRNKDKRVFIVHTIYTNCSLSLGLYKYPETEQDWQTNIKDIKPYIKLNKKK
jgi:hypothetical protein